MKYLRKPLNRVLRVTAILLVLLTLCPLSSGKNTLVADWDPLCTFGVAQWYDFYSEAVDMGAGWGRRELRWDDVEAADDQWDLRELDGYCNGFEEYEMHGALLVKTGLLGWATMPNIYGDEYYGSSFPPLDLSEVCDEQYGYSRSYYDYIFHVAERVCGRRIEVLVIENELNSLKFFYGTWREYLRMLQTAHKAAHDACPDIIVTDSGIASGLWGWCIADDMLASGEFADEDILRFVTGYYRRSNVDGDHDFTGPNGMNKLLHHLESNARGIAMADSLIPRLNGAVDAFNFHYYEDYDYLDDVVDWLDLKTAEGGFSLPDKMSNEFGIRNRNGQYDRESLAHGQDVIKKITQSLRCGLRAFCWFPMSDGYNAGGRYRITTDKIGLGDGYPKYEGGDFVPRYASMAYTFTTSILRGAVTVESEDRSVENVVHWNFVASDGGTETHVTALWWDNGNGEQGSTELTIDLPTDVDDVVIRQFPDIEVHVDPAELGGQLPLLVTNDPVLISYSSPTGVETDGGDSPSLPRVAKLGQNYPNPFNPRTMINFSIAGEAGSGVDVSLSVFTPRGGKIRTLLEGRLQPGDHTVTWDGRDDRGVQVPSSIYLYTLISGRERVTRKMTLCQ